MKGINKMTRTIIIPNRDKSGWLHGTRQVTVYWHCPICKTIMGEPRLQQFCEDGEFYNVHVWDNPCGHVAKYKDLVIL